MKNIQVIKPYHPILIVEDSNEDFKTTERALRKSKLVNPIVHCVDGDDALDYLLRKGKHSNIKDAPRPGLILLDLNLPGTDGREVLQTIKNNSELRTIPTIVLTTSVDEGDIEACYNAGANSYIQKPVDLAGFFSAIERLKDYWFGVVILPMDEAI